MYQVQVPITFQWDAGNRALVSQNGITTDDCEKAVRYLAAHTYDSAIWRDTINPRRGQYEQRFVAAICDVFPVGNIFICFTTRHRRIHGMPKVIRIITARRTHKREPILRVSVPERFVPAPPLHQLLGA